MTKPSDDELRRRIAVAKETRAMMLPHGKEDWPLTGDAAICEERASLRAEVARLRNFLANTNEISFDKVPL